MTLKRSIIGGLLILPVIAPLGAACNDDSAESGDSIEVSAVFARAALDRGGVYMIIENTGNEDDALMAADAPIAGQAELHQTITEGAGVRMEPVDRIDLPACETVELRPGGLHVMLQGLTEPIKAGDEVALTLTFENAGAIEVTATGREYGDTSNGMDGEMGN